jgi:predicted GNAT family acetyltransferase
MPLLIEALGDFPVDSVVGPFASAKACAHTLGFRHLKVRLQNYALLEPPATQTAPGHARLMERKDIPWLTDWFSAFEIECNLPCSPRPELMQQFEEDLVRGSPRRCRIWEAGGESVAMANMVCIGAVARIGPVYTAPGQRARGYAGALVAHLGTEAFAQGALAVCLYADAENPVSNALYQRIGFRHIGDFGQFERDGSP